MYSRKIGPHGQITLPKQVQQWLGVSEGDSIVFLRDGDEVKIIPIKRTLLDLRGVISVAEPQDFEKIRRKAITGRIQKRRSSSDEVAGHQHGTG